MPNQDKLYVGIMLPAIIGAIVGALVGFDTSSLIKIPITTWISSGFCIGLMLGLYLNFVKKKEVE